jgi:hypothetical protein
MPVQIAGNVAFIAARGRHSFYVTTAGKLYAMGDNSVGQLGDGTKTNRITPVHIADNVASVAAGETCCLYVTTDGKLFGMGVNDHGQIGDGTTTDRTTPAQIAGNVITVKAGYEHGFYMTADGKLYAIGKNDYGQIGDGTKSDRRTPVLIANNVISVSTYFEHSLYVTGDGELFAMGRNDYGQIGDGTTIDRTPPVRIVGDAVTVATGSFHSLYATTDGKLYAMGYNGYGQLGDGSTTARSIPVFITSLNTQNPSAPPSITAQPQSQTVNVGDTAVFNVAAIGATPLSYQWYFNDAILSGKTAANLTLDNVTTANAGGYTVKISNAAGEITSAAALLTVNVPTPGTPPSITTQPQSQTINVGGTAIFSVTASGAAPLTYQWYFNGVILSEETTATLTLANVTAANAGVYTVKITNAVGEITSDVATLTVNTSTSGTPPSITAQPQSRTVNAGGTAAFSVTVSGTAPLNLQWYFNGAILSGKTTATLTISNVTTANAGAYTVKVTNAVGEITSAAATLTVNTSTSGTPPSITAQPQSRTVNEGSTATFTVFASGTAPLSYQWYFNGVLFSGKNTSTLIISKATTAHAGIYTVKVKNSAGEITSAAASLVVNTTSTGLIAPSITVQPQSQTVNEGNTVVFSVSSTGTTPLSYQWYFNGAALPGKNAAMLIVSNASAVNEGAYTVKIANAAGEVTSEEATLALSTTSVNPTVPNITTQPQSQTANVSSTVLFNVSATGAAPLSYQWYFNGAVLSGKTAATLTLANVTAANAGVYTVKISNAAGEVESEPATLTVNSSTPNTPPSITAQPQSRTINAGENVVFNVSATGAAPLSYQWYCNGIVLDGETAATLTLAHVTAANAGVYTVKISNAAGAVTSTAATLTVNLPPIPPQEITVAPGAGAPVPVPEQKGLLASVFDLINGIVDSGDGVPVAQGSTVRYAVPDNADYTYQWKKNGVEIANATNSFYDAPNANANDRYTVVVSSPGFAPTEYTVPAVKIISPPEIVSQPAGAIFREGEKHILRVSAKGPGQLYYQWYRNGAAIPNAVLETYTIADATAADAGVYQAKVANYSGVTVPSEEVQIEIVGAARQTLALAEISGTETEFVFHRDGSFLAFGEAGVHSGRYTYTLLVSGELARVHLAGGEGEFYITLLLNLAAGTYTIEMLEEETAAAPVSEEGFFEFVEEEGETNL